jgi:hypothetical protein
MSRRPFQADDRDTQPESLRGSSYPPDIARRRRELGLPVTPEEHARYEAGEMREPPVTSAQMAVRLRAVAAACDGYLRGVFLEIATRIEQRRPVPVPLAKQAGPLGHAILAVQARERDPGEEG